MQERCARWGRAVAALAVLLAASALGQEALRVEVTDGAGAVVPAQALSSRRFAVAVKDAGGRPVPGATVHFRLPAEGPSGVFASGLRTESTVTGAQGEAVVYGIRWGAQPGRLEILVTATEGGRRGEARIPVEVSATARMAREDRGNPSFRAPSGSKRWVLWVAVGAGAAAGLAAAGGRGGNPQTYAPPAAVVVTPTIGTPTITIGKP
jgi:hypothetical protein